MHFTKFLSAVPLLLPLALFAQSEDIEKKHRIKKDTMRTIAEIIINTDRKLQVNHLNLKGLEAPMGINVVTYKLLEKMNITKLEDAVKNIPGINSISQYGGFQFFNIRGFDDFVLLNDGIRDERHNITQSAPMTNLANVERVESLKGPSGEMFGHSALGGIINIVRKKPTAQFKGNTSFSVGSFDTYNFILGVGGPINTKLRYRFDVGVNKTEGWRNVKENTNNFSGVLQYLVNDRTSLEFYLQYSKDSYAGDAGIPSDSAGNILTGIDYKKNYANPFDFIKNSRKEVYLRFNHNFLDNSKLINILSYSDDNIDYMLDEVLFYNSEENKISLYNGPYHFNHITRPASNQLTYNFNFKTWNIKHNALAGNTISYLSRKTFYRNISYAYSSTAIPTEEYLNFGEREPGDISRVFEIEELLIGTYFHDWIELSKHFKFLAGMRYDYFSGKYNPRRNLDAPVVTNYDNFNNFSYRLGMSYQPIENLMNVYASVSNFFKPSRSHNHRTNSTFLPQRGFQTEVGIKLSKSNLYNIAISSFYIEKSNVIVGHNILSQVGGARSQGVEVDADLSLFRRLYLKLGYAYTDAKFISKGQTEEETAIIGNYTPWTPKHTFNSWINYDFSESLEGLGAGVGFYFIDKAYQNQFNTQSLPAYALVNGTIYYKTKNNIRLGLNIENIFDKLYIKGALSRNDLYSNVPVYEPYQSQMQVYPGRRRNYRLTLSYQF